MEFSFAQENIADWAGFSGDRNPIHFDARAASLVGAEDIIVHGMLVMLPVKQRCSQAVTNKEDGWFKFNARLKAPVLVNRRAKLDVMESGGGARFKLMNADADAIHISGKCAAVDKSHWQSDQPYFLIERQDAKKSYDEFIKTYPDQRDLWVWLDAMIFSKFLDAHISSIINALDKKPGRVNGEYRLENMTKSFVVQTTHTSIVNTTLGRQSMDSFSDDQEIKYQIGQIHVAETDVMAAGTVEIGVFYSKQHMMTIELGLMLKQEI